MKANGRLLYCLGSDSDGVWAAMERKAVVCPTRVGATMQWLGLGLLLLCPPPRKFIHLNKCQTFYKVMVRRGTQHSSTSRVVRILDTQAGRQAGIVAHIHSVPRTTNVGSVPEDVGKLEKATAISFQFISTSISSIAELYYSLLSKLAPTQSPFLSLASILLSFAAMKTIINVR